MSKRTIVYNEGQYALKPWMANVIMGILELAISFFWVISVFKIVFNSSSLEEADIAISILLIVCYLVWNILVWTIKPLRTRFNWKEAKLNVFLIIATIIDIVYTLIIAAQTASEFGGGFEGF